MSQRLGPGQKWLVFGNALPEIYVEFMRVEMAHLGLQPNYGSLATLASGERQLRMRHTRSVGDSRIEGDATP